MRLLALDPGAKRMGWAVVSKGNSGPLFHGSGIIGLTRGASEKYQDYRIRLIQYIVLEGSMLLATTAPGACVSEILPVRGFNNMSQPLLAATAITTMQTLCHEYGMPLYQIGANTVKVHMAKHNRATKAQVRNGVLLLLPELLHKKSQWTKEFDEPDAIAVGLTYLGYDLRTPVVEYSNGPSEEQTDGGNPTA